MFLNNCPNGAVLSTYYSKQQYEKIVTDFLTPMLDKIHKNATFDINYLNGIIHVDFPVFTDDTQYWTVEDDEELEALSKAGFSQNGDDNYQLIIEKMCPNENISTFVDDYNDTITLEFHGKGREVLAKLDTLFEQLPNLNREETGVAISQLYKLLNTEWNWSR